MRGDWELLGSPGFEEKVLKMKPLIGTRKESVLRDNELKALSLNPDKLPESKMPSLSTGSVSRIDDGDIDFRKHQGHSLTYPAPKTPPKIKKNHSNASHSRFTVPKKGSPKKK